MGVPFFFRWLSRRYPKILLPLTTICDNLYLDFNGILHTFLHPERGPQPKDFDEVMRGVCAYLDQLIQLLKPQKLLFISFDGVGPRAKLNDQRGRRFRSAKEKEESPLDPAAFGSNIITPGTTFMSFASEALTSHISLKMRADPDWSMNVIFSDSSTPGEGEHKILEYIRTQSQSPGYDPTTKHMLYGNDADLIMLGLSLHLPNITLLRELPKKRAPKHKKQQPQKEWKKRATHVVYMGNLPHSVTDLDELLKDFPESSQKSIQKKLYSNPEKTKKHAFLEFSSAEEAAKCCLDLAGFVVGGKIIKVDRPIHLPDDFKLLHDPNDPTTAHALSKDFALLSIDILRKSILEECPQFNQGDFFFHPEYIIDDFVCLTFLVGNDFLPELPGYAIWNDVFETVVHLYFKKIHSYGGYLTNCGKLNLGPLSSFFDDLAKIEDRIFQRNHKIDEKKRFEELSEDDKKKELDKQNPNINKDPELNSYLDVLQVEEQMFDFEQGQASVKSLSGINIFNSERKIEFHVPDYEQRYQAAHFPEVKISLVCEKYLSAVEWTLGYYRQLLPSWEEFYPFHYAPLASVLAKYLKLQVDPSQPKLEESVPREKIVLTSLGKPFLPFQQLLAVLPPQSRHYLPPALQPLMAADSPISCFYPTTFDIDIIGPFEWNGNVLLDFIDGRKLLETYYTFTDGIQWTESEQKLNTHVFTHKLFCNPQRCTLQPQYTILEQGICCEIDAPYPLPPTQPDQTTAEATGLSCYQIRFPPLFRSFNAKEVVDWTVPDGSPDFSSSHEWMKFQKSNFQISRIKKPRHNKKKSKQEKQIEQKKFFGKAQSVAMSEIGSHLDLTKDIIEEANQTPVVVKPKPVVDESKPTTKIALKTPTGKTLVLIMNTDHTLGDLKVMVQHAMNSSGNVTLATVHPPMILEDSLNDKTLKEQGLLNTSVCLR